MSLEVHFRKSLGFNVSNYVHSRTIPRIDYLVFKSLSEYVIIVVDVAELVGAGDTDRSGDCPDPSESGVKDTHSPQIDFERWESDGLPFLR